MLRISFFECGDDGDDDDADECDHNHSDDDLHLAVAAVHLPLHCSRTGLEHLGVFYGEQMLPLRSSAFLWSPSRLTWLSSNLRVLSDMSSLIWVAGQVRR